MWLKVEAENPSNRNLENRLVNASVHVASTIRWLRPLRGTLPSRYAGFRQQPSRDIRMGVRELVAFHEHHEVP